MSQSNNKNRTLFLWLNDNEFHAINAKRRGVDTENVYKQVPVFFKIIRRIQIILNIFSISPWLESWKHRLDCYDTIIIHASRITSPVVKYIHKKNKKKRIIVWYWNPISKCEKLEKYPANICERWTFDLNDSKHYNINYNSQYYFDDVKLDECPVVNDVMFVGGDKGRYNLLMDIKLKINQLNFKTDFHITKTTHKQKPFREYKKRISYKELLNKISASKAILDIVSQGQTGLTLRPLEAMFLRKKLITNDQSIKDWECYHPNNIFILDKDNYCDLDKFLNSNYSNISDDFLNYYDFDDWFNRFFIN